MYSCSSVGQPGGSFHSFIKRERVTTQSWEGKDLRHLKNIAIRSHDLWSHFPRPTYAIILLPIIPSFPPSFLPSFHNTRSPSCYNRGVIKRYGGISFARRSAGAGAIKISGSRCHGLSCRTFYYFPRRLKINLTLYYGAINGGYQVKALNWLLRIITIKTLNKEEKEKKQNN